jgi:hypothetical protein
VSCAIADNVKTETQSKVRMICFIELGTPWGLVPENETQHETDTERSENRSRWIFANIILAVFSKRTHAPFRFVQRLAGFVSIILRHCRHRRFQIFGRGAPFLPFAVRRFILRTAFTRCAPSIFISHFCPLGFDLQETLSQHKPRRNLFP